MNRSISDGMHCEHVPLASIRLIGKGWLDENDNYTFITRLEIDTRWEHLDVGFAETWEKTRTILRWAFGLSLARGKHF